MTRTLPQRAALAKPTPGLRRDQDSGHSTEDTMKHATRIKTFARQAGGAVRSLAQGAVFTAGIMGLTHLGGNVAGITGIEFGDLVSQNEQGPTTAEMAMVANGFDRFAQRLSLAEVETQAPTLHASFPDNAPKLALQTELDELATENADPFVQEDGALSAEMARVLDWISDTYRVSEAALEPALVEAESAARQLGFDPLLIVAIMGIESSYNPRAVSHVGAQGLMQVMPRYHKDKIGPNAGRNALFDPETNVRVGALVLQEGLQRYGSMQRALQYYNGSLKDPKARYTRKVMALKKRLMTVAGRTAEPMMIGQAG